MLAPLIHAALDRLRTRVPDRVLRYAIPLVSLAFLAAFAYAVLHLLPPRHPALYVLYVPYFILLLGAAWLGYGPGLLTCFLLVVLPRVLGLGTNRRALTGEAIRLAVMAIVCVLVSRLSQNRRRRETDLRQTAEMLESRVRERTEEAVRSADTMRQTIASMQEQAQLLDLAHDAILTLDRDYTIRFCNPGAERMYGWSRGEMLGKISYELFRTEFPEGREAVEASLLTDGHWDGEVMHTRRDGSRIRVASRWAVRRDAEGSPLRFLEICTDVTERRRVDEQLRHTQKLESLGILAGGVAHDFNNLLTGILGNASLALDGLPPHYRDRDLIEEVVKAAQRAAELTRQLLAYAGKGRFVLKTVDLTQLVREISGLVQTSIPKRVQIRLELAEGLPGVDADPGQLQQVVMNLVINGAEAIGNEGGTVLVQTCAQPVDEDYITTLATAGELLKPGAYVCLEVHDTGCGMPEETIGKIFDPFFTTKFAGRGLGLSAVMGIVRGHKGALKVYSTPGRGTTFKVLFPASTQAIALRSRPAVGSLLGVGTIMIVDDEEVVRETARKALERCGYAALTAEDGAKAVEQYRHFCDAVALVLLDLTMPVMSGEQALREMQRINPKVRVLLSSGFNEVEAIQRFAGKGLAGFIQKPYTANALAEKVKEVLME